MDANPSTVLKRFASGLSDDEIRFLSPRLEEGYAGDFAEALARLDADPDVASLFAAAGGFKEFEDLVEAASRAVQAEAKARQRPRPKRR